MEANMAKEVIFTKLVQDAKQIIETARKNAVRSVDFCRVQMFWKPIGNALRSQLNWFQYKMLIAISDPDKREYYELEAVNNSRLLYISHYAFTHLCGH